MAQDWAPLSTSTLSKDIAGISNLTSAVGTGIVVSIWLPLFHDTQLVKG